MAYARYIGGGADAQTAMGEVEEQTWTTIAADRDGEPLPDAIGTRKTTRRIHFALRAECEDWLSAQTANGWTWRHGPTPCATPFYGETDSPSNCWTAEVERVA